MTHALITDDHAGDVAMAAVEPRQGAPYQEEWDRAARCGLADPRLRTAAEACFRAALEALPRLGAGAALTGAVAAFADRHVSTGRSPAAVLIDQAARHPAWLDHHDPDGPTHDHGHEGRA
ncbi:hypothetical protein ACFQQB_41945 [Nonomuraea rubra]|uniref:hypothetical protein n=1 Tax=Nonomuraea rubra TaxID=46180 RepID=UPI003611ABD0